MIKEIQKPMPTIKEYQLIRKIVRIAEREKTYKKLGFKDVSFDNIEIINELAYKCNIPYMLAQNYLSSYFEVIKEQLLNCKVVNLNKLGKFYINAPTRDWWENIVMPGNRCYIFPRFKTSKYLRKNLNKQENNNQ